MFYHMGPVTGLVARLCFRLESFILVNLLAGRHLFPEFVAPTSSGPVWGKGTPSEKLPALLAAHALRWLEDRAAYESLCVELRDLKRQVAQPGACDRAAVAILELARGAGRRAA